MGFLKNQFLDVVEWEEWRDDMIFWKWENREIKKNSRLIIKPGQDAVFLYNGKIEGIFKEDGDYNIESEIIPFLSTLKGFKFGFNSGLRAEVLFINTKEFVVKWGTQNPINIPSQTLPGGLPIRANGTFHFRLNEQAYDRLIENIAGVKQQYCVADVKIRITAVLDQLLMKWITKEGKDIFNLQANAFEISKGILQDLSSQSQNDGILITAFQIMSFTYPEEIQNMITKNAAQSMVGDVGRYQQLSMTDAMAEGKLSGGSMTGDMASMMMGMQMAGQMVNQMNQSMNMQNQQMQNQTMASAGQNTTNQAVPQNLNNAQASSIPNFCPNCGSKTNGANFCGNCGQKLH